MKKYFEYIGLLAFTCFSFYYTEKVTKIMNSKDPVMKSIEEYKEKTKTTCKEGYITTDGVVLGVSGLTVNVEESYSNMQGVGYQEDLMVWDKVDCKINLETTKDNYIIKGNEATNSVSIFIDITDGTLLEKIINISEQKNVKLNLIVTGSILETYKDYMKELNDMGYNIIYGGKEKNDFKKYLNIVKSYNNFTSYCVSLDETSDIIDMCKKENISSIKAKKQYSKNILLNTKKELEKGSFFVYKENLNTINELSATINFIKGKQIKIVNLNEMLK